MSRICQVLSSLFFVLLVILSAIFIFSQHKSITDLEEGFSDVFVYLDSHGSEHDGVVASNSMSHTSLNTENSKVRKQAYDNVILFYTIYCIFSLSASRQTINREKIPASTRC